MHYPKFTKAIIQHFISKDKSISMRNKIFMHTIRDDTILGSLRFVSKYEEYQVYGALIPKEMTNRKMQDSIAYKTYLAFITRAAFPKKARKFKKPASPSKKKTLVIIEEPTEKPAKKPYARRQFVSVQIRDTLLKKAIKQSRRKTNIHQAGGSTEGASLEPEVPDEPKGKSSDISEGTGLKLGVLDVPKAVSSETVDHNKTDDEEEDEFVHTPDDYVPTDDENREGEGKDDEEMTDAGQVDAEHENVSQEVAAIRATVKSEVPTVVKEYLGTSLDDALYKALQRHSAELVKEHFVPTDVLQHQQNLIKEFADIERSR
ncbi:hypothetical protein Tco_0078857 [Tanacetum coccineum]